MSHTSSTLESDPAEGFAVTSNLAIFLPTNSSETAYMNRRTDQNNPPYITKKWEQPPKLGFSRRIDQRRFAFSAPCL